MSNCEPGDVVVFLRYLVFANSYWDRSGGWDAYVGRASSIDEAKTLLESHRVQVAREGINVDVWQIVDILTATVVEEKAVKPV